MPMHDATLFYVKISFEKNIRPEKSWESYFFTLCTMVLSSRDRYSNQKVFVNDRKQWKKEKLKDTKKQKKKQKKC